MHLGGISLSETEYIYNKNGVNLKTKHRLVYVQVHGIKRYKGVTTWKEEEARQDHPWEPMVPG